MRTCSGGEVEARRHLRPVDVQPLRRDVDVDASLAVRDREPGLGAEERLVLDADLVDPLDRHVARGVGIAVADDDVPHDVRPVVLAVAVAGVGRSGWRSARSVARSMSVTASSGSYSTRIFAAARRACSGCSAATSATGSPK